MKSIKKFFEHIGIIILLAVIPSTIMLCNYINTNDRCDKLEMRLNELINSQERDKIARYYGEKAAAIGRGHNDSIAAGFYGNK